MGWWGSQVGLPIIVNIISSSLIWCTFQKRENILIFQGGCCIEAVLRLGSANVSWGSQEENTRRDGVINLPWKRSTARFRCSRRIFYICKMLWGWLMLKKVQILKVFEMWQRVRKCIAHWRFRICELWQYCWCVLLFWRSRRFRICEVRPGWSMLR